MDASAVEAVSIASPADPSRNDIKDDDWLAIAQKLDKAVLSFSSRAVDQAPEQSWFSPVSGNSGTFLKIGTAELSGPECIAFQTTANTITGIRLYNGTACRDSARRFAVVEMNANET
ncbi:RT0821/Lpp0805 family surface protein [Labrenzia sp. THAF82]|uniref:RT0821/Lpp0805 family surface protein n=1 Tax=Labrenzia sp. THAF82 TaxID=2587861 RepID=UPI00352B4541